ncbi:hypothetical protein PVK06_011038 [Gossypium arboreum]|uniref:CHASE domain-containing protein n=1 Tax=Gossypium arboreum TaxID=29729 RepID=A0ABR0Q7X6_GOSAR|nr:hypothetical protein PVK06_011038 [Gossypium arboreum]
MEHCHDLFETFAELLGSHHLGVMLTFSVYKSKLPPSLAEQERIEETVGYLGGAVDVESLMENLLGNLLEIRQF